METMQELLPFAREMLSKRAGWHLVKVYLVGSVLATLGVAVGVIEAVTQMFSAEEHLEVEPKQMPWKNQQVLGVMEAHRLSVKKEEEKQEEEVQKIQFWKQPQEAAGGRRNSANRLHAS